MIRIYGHITDINTGTIYDVSFVNTITDEDPEPIPIEENSDRICFDFSEPLSIESDYSDTFSHIIIKQATINLIVNENVKKLFFAGNEREMLVTVQVHEGPILFQGYADPLIFNEPYATDWTMFSITCSDRLSTTKYKKWGEIAGIDPTVQTSPMDIIQSICDQILLTPDISKLPAKTQQILNGTLVNNQVFFGDSPDDWKKCDEVLEEIGKYAGVWFSQEGGGTLRCFSWHSSAKDGTKEITAEDFLGDDLNLSVSDVYTQIKLTCDLKDQETLIEFGSSDLEKCYPAPAKYMEEYISCGWYSTPAGNFFDLVDSDGADIKGESFIIENYANILKSGQWDFGENGYLSVVESNPTEPQKVLEWLRSIYGKGKGAFVSFGKKERQKKDDNSLTNSISMKESLLISVMGKDSLADNSVISSFTDPICVYKGSSTSIMPPNTGVTNYIVITGKLLLNPLYAQSSKTDYMNRRNYKDIDAYFKDIAESGEGNLYKDSEHTFADYKGYISEYKALKQWQKKAEWPKFCGGSIPSLTDNDQGAYYLQKFFKGLAGQEKYSAIPQVYGDLKWTKYQQQFKYERSMINGVVDEVDNISKIPVLVCQLKVGNKYCVERTDLGVSGWNRFEWLTEEQCPYDSNAGEKNMYFTIGFDPKLGNFMIGEEHDIANTISFEDGVDAKGTAIPIRAEDNLNGDFEFKILRPCDSTWDIITHWSSGWWLWKKSGWSVNTLPIIQKLQSILVSNFKVEVVSDKGKIQNLDGGGDLVYASAENTNYIEEHEDDVSISTMLTSYECSFNEVDVKISPSHVMNEDGSPFLGTSYTGTGDKKLYRKPEHDYVDSFYSEYSVPRTVIEGTFSLQNQFSYIIKPYSYNFTLDYNYYKETGNFTPIAAEAKLKEGKVKYKMKNMS